MPDNRERQPTIPEEAPVSPAQAEPFPADPPAAVALSTDSASDWKKEGRSRNQLEEGQEVDVWWGSYSGRTMLPSFGVCGLLTLAIAGVSLYLVWGKDYHSTLVRYAAYLAVGVIWGLQLGRWAYRTVSINYRLTNRCLFRDRGFRHPSAGQVALAQVREVRVEEGSRLERFLGIGRVRVVGGNGAEVLMLEGVYDPEGAANTIRKQVEQVRQGAVETEPSSTG